jgi:hypothetical protein
MNKLIRNSTVEFLTFTSSSSEDSIEVKVYDREILKDTGKVIKKIADSFALIEFEKYRVAQDRLFLNDFDKLLEDINKENK